MKSTTAAYNKLNSLQTAKNRVLCIHCSRQNLTGNEGGLKTPRITAIIVKSLDGMINKSFAIHLEAEKTEVIWEEIENYYDLLEERMIIAFNIFVAAYREYSWLHWDMDGVHFGFEALEHRYCVLIDLDEKGLNRVPVENRINLGAVLKDLYGANFELEPVFENLMKSNNSGATKPGFLTLDQEALAFTALDFPKILESVRAKVDFQIEVLGLAINKVLKVSSRNFLARLGTFVRHPIVSALTAIGTLIGAAIAIYTVF
jgi:hypothetical protein